MNKFILLFMFMLVIGSTSAELAWEQPITVRSFDNIEFSGTSLLTADGCHLLMWWQNYLATPQYFLRLYDTQYQPLWDAPLPIDTPFRAWDIVETTDSCFVLTYGDSQVGIRALRISREGEFIWGSQGISVFSTYWSNMMSDLKADMMGGVYFAWCGESYNGGSCAIQHIDAGGNFTIQSTGVIIESASTSYYVSLLTLPDNSVVVNWTIPNMTKMQRVNISGVFMWPEVVSIASDSSYPYGVLCAFTDATFALSIIHGNYIGVQRYNYSGVALWSQSVTALAVNNIYRFSLRAAAGSDNSLFITAETSNSKYLQKVSAEGVVQFADGIDLTNGIGFLDGISPALPDDSGGCVVVATNYANPNNIHAIQVSNTGIVTVHQITDTANYKEQLSASKFGNSIYIEWQERETMRRGIKAQILDPLLQPQLEPNGIELVFGGAGKVQGVQNAARTNGSAVIWIQSSLNPEHWDLYLQIYSSQGQPLLSAGGIKINREGSDLVGANMVVCNANLTIVEWGETLGGESSKRYQIFDENGNILLADGGNRVGSPEQTVGVVNVSSHDGYWYMIWTVSNAIWGQKFSGTTALWGTGIQLTQPHPEIAGNIDSCNLEFPWLTWKLGGVKPMLTRIDESGTIQPGFPAYGINLPIQDGSYVLFRHTFTVCGDNLHALLGFYDSGVPEPYYVESYRHTLISPEGEFLFPLANLPVESNFNVFCDNTNFYIGDYYSSYVVRRYDTSGSIIATYNVSVPAFQNGGWEVLGSKFLSDGELLLLVRGYLQGSPALRHIFITPQWVMDLPEDNIVFSVGEYFPPSISWLGDRAWASTAAGRTYNYDGSATVLLQGVGMEGVANPDDHPQAPELPRLVSCSPNPFNPETRITFSLPQAGKVKVTVYDLRGRKIRVLLNSELPEGMHSLNWDGQSSAGRELASGIYIVNMEAAGTHHSRKVTLLK